MVLYFSAVSVTICYSSAGYIQMDLNLQTSQIFVLCGFCLCKLRFSDVNLMSVKACNGLMGDPKKFYP
jgi:hypothetical protein